jgi:hypothetical protein
MALKLNLLPLPPNAPELSALWPISIMHMYRFQGEMVIQVGYMHSHADFSVRNPWHDSIRFRIFFSWS